MVTNMVTGGLADGLKDCIQANDDAGKKRCAQYISKMIKSSIEKVIPPKLYGCVTNPSLKADSSCIQAIHDALFGPNKIDERLWKCIKLGVKGNTECSQYLHEILGGVLRQLGLDPAEISKIITFVTGLLPSITNEIMPALKNMKNLLPEVERIIQDIDQKQLIQKVSTILDEITENKVIENIEDMVKKVEGMDLPKQINKLMPKINEIMGSDIGACLKSDTGSKTKCKKAVSSLSSALKDTISVDGIVKDVLKKMWPILLMIPVTMLYISFFADMLAEQFENIGRNNLIYITVFYVALLGGAIAFVVYS